MIRGLGYDYVIDENQDMLVGKKAYTGIKHT